jgi:hypothetical protein
MIKFNDNKNLSELQLENSKQAFTGVTYRTTISLQSFACDEKKVATSKTEFYDDRAKLLSVITRDPSKEPVWNTVGEHSPMALMHRFSCQK